MIRVSQGMASRAIKYISINSLFVKKWLSFPGNRE